MPPTPVAGEPFLPRPREEEEFVLEDETGTGGVLTETVSPPPPWALIGSCDGIESMSCEE